jgi:hypothetical protein
MNKNFNPEVKVKDELKNEVKYNKKIDKYFFYQKKKHNTSYIIHHF